ncbi:MAG: uracil-DNA glycosylase [Planctomycetia bacterium]|nr:uracil-DNA glycosylase [Planctomycetia bacterium]
MQGTPGRQEGASTGGPTAGSLRQRLESLAEAGVLDLPRRGGRRPASKTETKPPVASCPPTASRAGDDAMAHERRRTLELLGQEVAACRLCEELASARTNTVFGVGPADARLCFMGEAPGADEDASGVPFVGRAGQLLTKIIESCRLSREQVYILNVLKCRPPNNRPPLPAEVAHCRRFFERQLEVIGPEFICCLGTSAAQALLQTAEPIGRLRGRWFTHGSAQVLCTYHPSYLLRNPAAKRDVWDDMKRLMARMGVDL